MPFGRRQLAKLPEHVPPKHEEHHRTDDDVDPPDAHRAAVVANLIVNREVVGQIDHAEPDRHRPAIRVSAVRLGSGELPDPVPQPRGTGADRFAAAKMFEIFGEFVGAGVTVAGVFFEAFEADRLQVAVNGRVDRPRFRRRRLAHLLHDRQGMTPLEGQAAGELLKQNGAEREQIGGDAQLRFATRLLGGHVRRRADRIARLGEGHGAIERPGDAKIGDKRFPGIVHENVVRLQVAVQDPALMGVMHRPGDLGQQTGAFDRRSPRPVGQAGAIDPAHADERLAVGLAHRVNGDDVRMGQAGGRLGLEAKSRQFLGSGKITGADRFDRLDPAQREVGRLVDPAHAAAGNLFQRTVARKRRRDAIGRARTLIRGNPTGRFPRRSFRGQQQPLHSPQQGDSPGEFFRQFWAGVAQLPGLRRHAQIRLLTPEEQQFVEPVGVLLHEFGRHRVALGTCA